MHSSYASLNLRQKGFSLLELLIVIAIASVLASIAAPSFNGIIKDNRITTSVNELAGSLYLARSESVKRNSRVTLCPSSNGSACAASGSLASGWIIFTDHISENASVDSGEDVIYIKQALDNRISVSTTLGDNYISYLPSGRVAKTTGAFQSGSITFCDDRTGNHGTSLVLINSGRFRVEKDASCSSS